MEVILYQPEIPQNAGHIVRTCKATGASLVMVEPLGFSISSRYLKRAGLDYWDGVDVKTIQDLESYLVEQEREPIFFTSKGTKAYTEAIYTEKTSLIFGAETSGLPESIFEKYPECLYRVPMKPEARCLNLANTVAVALYEGVRQQTAGYALNL